MVSDEQLKDMVEKLCLALESAINEGLPISTTTLITGMACMATYLMEDKKGMREELWLPAERALKIGNMIMEDLIQRSKHHLN